MAMTPFLPTIAAMVITTMIAPSIRPFVPRRDIPDRMAYHDRAIDDNRLTPRHGGADHDRRGRRAGRGIDRDRTRGVEDWHGQPKIEADGNSCLGGASQSDCGDHGDQSEQMFGFHGRSDGGGGGLFDSQPLIKTEEYCGKR